MLQDITKNHKYWIEFAKKVGSPRDKAEDFVQDMYIKIYERYSCYESYAINGTITEGFFAVCLKNLILDFLKNKTNKKMIYDSDLTEYVSKNLVSELPDSSKESFDVILDKIDVI